MPGALRLLRHTSHLGNSLSRDELAIVLCLWAYPPMVVCVLLVSDDLAVDSVVSGVLDGRLGCFIWLLVEKSNSIFASLIVSHIWQLNVKVEIKICVIISRCLSFQGLHLDFLRKYTHGLHFAFLNELYLVHPAEESTHSRSKAGL